MAGKKRIIKIAFILLAFVIVIAGIGVALVVGNMKDTRPMDFYRV